MTTKTTLAAALLLAALAAPVAHADSSGLAAVQCSFATHADYQAADAAFAKSFEPAQPRQLADVCAEVRIELPAVGDPCPDYRSTFVVDWVFAIGGTIRDPIVGGATYKATVTTSETWVKSNSHCVLASYDCDIMVTDGSRFHKAWFTYSGYGVHEERWGQYKQLALSDVRVSCLTVQASGAIVPGLYVYGGKE